MEESKILLNENMTKELLEAKEVLQEETKI